MAAVRTICKAGNFSFNLFFFLFLLLLSFTIIFLLFLFSSIFPINLVLRRTQFLSVASSFTLLFSLQHYKIKFFFHHIRFRKHRNVCTTNRANLSEWKSTNVTTEKVHYCFVDERQGIKTEYKVYRRKKYKEMLCLYVYVRV